MESIIRAKLVYGLESAALNDAQKNILNAFQLKGIRIILNITTTFVDRTHTNKFVIEKANEELKRAGAKAPKDSIKMVSEYIEEKTGNLMAHMNRCQRQMTPHTLEPNYIKSAMWAKN